MCVTAGVTPPRLFARPFAVLRTAASPCAGDEAGAQAVASPAGAAAGAATAAQDSDTVAVSARQLRQIAVAAAVPMVGFGMMDNFVMIQAGDLIDSTLGVTFGLSTLTAAACGQIFSDVSGVCFGGYVELLALKLGLPVAEVTAQQRTQRSAKIASTVGAVLGVVLGCCLGMTSLLFMDLDKAERFVFAGHSSPAYEPLTSHLCHA